jgi:peptidoglycan hydrolase-like protein with peptidoglycan-binding domain
MRRHIVMVTVVAMLATGLLTALARPASAFSGAFFPTQSVGNRGVDVRAIQYLLQQQGQQLDADGVFGPATESAVRAFQSAHGLTVDGIVGPATWSALAVTLRAGAQGPAVDALQVELNAKRSAGLAVSGVYDQATVAAVTAFQQHAGISVDGITGPVTWRNLAWHYDYPDFSVGICDQDPDGNGLANWGTGAAIGQLEEAVRRFEPLGFGQVPLGDVSFEHGGDIPAHASHDVGLDVDVWPIRTDRAQCTADRITWQSATYDRDATRALVQAIRAAAPGHVQFVLFNDPELIAEGLTVQYSGHDNHLHIRYCEKAHPSSLYVC